MAVAANRATRVTERAWIFLRTAGSLILAISIVIWAIAYYPHNPRVVQDELQQMRTGRREGARARRSRIRLIWKRSRQGSTMRSLPSTNSTACWADGQGHRAGRSSLGLGLADRLCGNRFVPSAGSCRCHVGRYLWARNRIDTKSEEDRRTLGVRLQRAVWDGTERPVFTLPVALSLMVFLRLCECAATLAVIRRETNSWRWPVFSFTYMTSLAYFGALITYQLGTWLRL